MSTNRSLCALNRVQGRSNRQHCMASTIRTVTFPRAIRLAPNLNVVSSRHLSVKQFSLTDDFIITRIVGLYFFEFCFFQQTLTSIDEEAPKI